MKFAIIAAGEGSRLAQEGIAVPKPLVKIHGEALIDRLIRIFSQNNADEIDIIVNQLHPEVERHVRSLKNPLIKLIAQTTPSSMHSFYALSALLGANKICLTTVDTIFREEEFKDYIIDFRSNKQDFDGMMAVTDYIEDEKPLYVSTDAQLKIIGFNDEKAPNDIYISGGIYCLNPSYLNTLNQCIQRGESRMRNFQRALVKDGLKLKACPFSKILDVDHASDILCAENFLTKE